MSKSTTQNYKWQTPNDDELVRDGAQAIRDLAASVDRDMKVVDNRAPVDPATKTWVGQQGFASEAYSKSLNLAGIGNLTVNTGAKILVGTAVGAVAAFSTVAVNYPTTVGFKNVYSVTACNGDFGAAPVTVHINTSSLTGFVAVVLVARDVWGTYKAGQGVAAGTMVRINYCVVGV